MDKRLKKLYRTNEYGYTHQDPSASISEELVEEFAEKYNLNTDAHRTCINCQLRQVDKYGEFKVNCGFIKRGLPRGSAAKAKEIAMQSDIPLDRARKILLSTIDPVAWAELMFGFSDDDPNWHIRDYQKEQLRCSSKRTVVREGRRSGKTFIIALKLIYYIYNLRLRRGKDSAGKELFAGPEIMVVTPYQAQLTNIFNEMEKLLKRNEELCSYVSTSSANGLYVKSPFFRMEFKLSDNTKAKISGFVSGMGVKTDGSGGGTIRGQSADIIYLDEMDMIPEEILEKVVTPILLTRSDTIMIATSTPIGKKGKFHEWCLERADYKEDYYPSTVLPHWSEIKEELEAESTSEGFVAEYMAQFIEGGSGVFKMDWVHNARADYEYAATMDYSYLRTNLGIPDPANMIKCIGIDWNKNAGTEFFVIGFSASVGKWVALEAHNVGASEYSAKRWVEEVIRLNFKWKPDYIYADEGYGHTIIEDLKLLSHRKRGKSHKSAMDEETSKIVDRLVSFNFSKNINLKDPLTGQTIVKSGKHYLVENAVRVLEDNRFHFPHRDEVLAKQFLNYIVLRRHATTNKPVYGMEKKSIGDHRLDAMMLALAGLSLEESIYSKNNLPYSKPGLVERRKKSDWYSSPDDDVDQNARALKKAGFPGALEIMRIMRGEGSIDSDRSVKQKYRTQEKTREKRSRGDIFHKKKTEPSVLESIQNQSNQFSSPQRSGPRRSKRGSRSWKKK
jgi:replicative DNA helicase